MKKRISIIIPCFNEQAVIEKTYETLTHTDFGGYTVEYIFVDDGSRDDTRKLLKRFASENKQVKVVGFTRNFGHQCAVSAGIAKAGGDAAVIIDADLQDPPAVILEMIRKWEAGYQIAYGKRVKRKGESRLKKCTAWAYYRVLRMLGGSYIPRDTGDFRLIDKKVVDFLNAIPERNRFLRGLTAWAGFSSCPVEYVREERAAGETKYTLKKMFRLAGDGITSFSDKPLKLPLYVGAVLLPMSLVYGVAATVLVILGIWEIGYVLFALVFTILSVTLVSLGIMGLYLSRIYDEAKGRPMYMIGEEINFNKEET